MNSTTTALWTELTDDRAEAVNGGYHCYYEKKYSCYVPKKKEVKCWYKPPVCYTPPKKSWC